jgi:hypothetical protein
MWRSNPADMWLMFDVICVTSRSLSRTNLITTLLATASHYASDLRAGKTKPPLLPHSTMQLEIRAPHVIMNRSRQSCCCQCGRGCFVFIIQNYVAQSAVMKRTHFKKHSGLCSLKSRRASRFGVIEVSHISPLAAGEAKMPSDLTQAVSPQSSQAQAQANANELNAQKQQQLEFEKKQKEIELWQAAQEAAINGIQA